MQRKRPPPAQRQIWTILLILALLVLFVLAAGTPPAPARRTGAG